MPVSIVSSNPKNSRNRPRSRPRRAGRLSHTHQPAASSRKLRRQLQKQRLHDRQILDLDEGVALCQAQNIPVDADIRTDHLVPVFSNHHSMSTPNSILGSSLSLRLLLDHPPQDIQSGPNAGSQSRRHGDDTDASFEALLCPDTGRFQPLSDSNVQTLLPHAHPSIQLPSNLTISNSVHQQTTEVSDEFAGLAKYHIPSPLLYHKRSREILMGLNDDDKELLLGDESVPEKWYPDASYNQAASRCPDQFSTKEGGTTISTKQTQSNNAALRSMGIEYGSAASDVSTTPVCHRNETYVQVSIQGKPNCSCTLLSQQCKCSWHPGDALQTEVKEVNPLNIVVIEAAARCLRTNTNLVFPMLPNPFLLKENDMITAQHEPHQPKSHNQQCEQDSLPQHNQASTSTIPEPSTHGRFQTTKAPFGPTLVDIATCPTLECFAIVPVPGWKSWPAEQVVYGASHIKERRHATPTTHPSLQRNLVNETANLWATDLGLDMEHNAACQVRSCVPPIPPVKSALEHQTAQNEESNPALANEFGGSEPSPTARGSGSVTASEDEGYCSANEVLEIDAAEAETLSDDWEDFDWDTEPEEDGTVGLYALGL